MIGRGQNNVLLFYNLIHVRTSGPDTGIDRKESTIAAPEATGHSHHAQLVTIKSHARVQTTACGERRTRFDLTKYEESEISHKAPSLNEQT